MVEGMVKREKRLFNVRSCILPCVSGQRFRAAIFATGQR